MKYKLIKEYPGSPKLGNIIDNLENDWIENYPEFWELVVEKDYEILEVKGKYGAISSYIEKLDNDLKDKTIFKIKRLSDGEIFTIGDKVINIYDKDITIINKFEFNHDTITINGNYARLSEINKSKQPLFTTEDGVDIYLGNKSWILHKNSWYLSPAAIVHNNPNWTPNENEAHWRFSTKEKAEEYILLNKPCLSYNEVLNATKIRKMSKTLIKLRRCRLTTYIVIL